MPNGQGYFHTDGGANSVSGRGAKSMIAAVIELGYPLWTLIYYGQETYHLDTAEQMEKGVTALGDALVYDRAELDDSEMKTIEDAVNPPGVITCASV